MITRQLRRLRYPIFWKFPKRLFSDLDYFKRSISIMQDVDSGAAGPEIISSIDQLSHKELSTRKFDVLEKFLDPKLELDSEMAKFFYKSPNFNFLLDELENVTEKHFTISQLVKVSHFTMICHQQLEFTPFSDVFLQKLIKRTIEWSNEEKIKLSGLCRIFYYLSHSHVIMDSLAIELFERLKLEKEKITKNMVILILEGAAAGRTKRSSVAVLADYSCRLALEAKLEFPDGIKFRLVKAAGQIGLEYSPPHFSLPYFISEVLVNDILKIMRLGRLRAKDFEMILEIYEHMSPRFSPILLKETLENLVNSIQHQDSDIKPREVLAAFISLSKLHEEHRRALNPNIFVTLLQYISDNLNSTRHFNTNLSLISRAIRIFGPLYKLVPDLPEEIALHLTYMNDFRYPSAVELLVLMNYDVVDMIQLLYNNGNFDQTPCHSLRRVINAISSMEKSPLRDEMIAKLKQLPQYAKIDTITPRMMNISLLRSRSLEEYDYVVLLSPLDVE